LISGALLGAVIEIFRRLKALNIIDMGLIPIKYFIGVQFLIDVRDILILHLIKNINWRQNESSKGFIYGVAMRLFFNGNRRKK
jgi:uncharacterized membrane protein YhfC